MSFYPNHDKPYEDCILHYSQLFFYEIHGPEAKIMALRQSAPPYSFFADSKYSRI